MAGQTINFRPSILNLLLYAGDGFTIRLLCKNKAGDPVDINGTVTAQVRLDRLHPDDPPLASFVVSLVDAYLGIIGLTLTAEETLALLPPGELKFTGVWDVQWTPSDLEPRTLVQGEVEVTADVTR